jgi:hypothetical protein
LFIFKILKHRDKVEVEARDAAVLAEEEVLVVIEEDLAEALGEALVAAEALEEALAVVVVDAEDSAVVVVVDLVDVAASVAEEADVSQVECFRNYL